jgi:hypothetical protein
MDSQARAHFDSQVRAAVNRGFLEAGGAAPTLDELSRLTGGEPAAVREALLRLESRSSLVLRPNTAEPWIAPPFSATPTLFLLRSRRGTFFGSCAWCALGVVTLLGEPARLETRTGGDGALLELELTPDGPGEDPGTFCVHFAVPVARWSESLGYACSTILLFGDDTEVDAWCARHRLPRGQVLTLRRTFELARAFFGDALETAPHRRRRADIEAIFVRLGLVDPFFSLG